MVKKVAYCERWSGAKQSLVVSFCRFCGQGNSWKFHWKLMCNSKQERYFFRCFDKAVGLSKGSPFPPSLWFIILYPVILIVKVRFAWLLSLTSSVHDWSKVGFCNLGGFFQLNWFCIDRWPWRNWIVTECPLLCEQWVCDIEGFPQDVFCSKMCFVTEKLMCLLHIPAKLTVTYTAA